MGSLYYPEFQPPCKELILVLSKEEEKKQVYHYNNNNENWSEVKAEKNRKQS